MKSMWFIVVILFLNCLFVSAQEPAKKVLIVIVDGIPATDLERVHTPNLDVIASQGGYVRAYTGGKKGGYSETPTISAVGYNSMLTGTWANKHNVWGNGIENPNYHYPSLFRIFKDAFPEKKTAIFSTWEDNRTKLLGENLPQTDFLKIDYSFDGFEMDTLTYPHDMDKDYVLKIDNLVSYEAEYILKNEAPDLNWVYMEYTDDMGHRFGRSPRMDRAIEFMDLQIGRLYEAVLQRQIESGEDWLVWVTTDHGRDEENGKDHGGQSKSERMIWMITNAKNLNYHFWSGQSAMVDILPTVSRFLGMEISEEISRELDGIPLIGPVSFSDLDLRETNNQLEVFWKPMDKTGNVKVYVSPTDDFSKGKRDMYQMIGEVALGEGKYTFSKDLFTSDHLKILVVGESNSGNVWWIRGEKGQNF